MDAQTIALKHVRSYIWIMSDPDTYHNGGKNNKGHVGAWLYSAQYNRWFWAQSYIGPEGKWVHAERAVLDKTHAALGEIPSDAVALTTLEPCSDVDRLDRLGCSCSELLANHNIKTVHCGALDDSQMVDGQRHQHAFSMLTTDDPVAIVACNELYRLVTL